METINRIPIQQAMFVQSNPTTVVNNDFQTFLMELFKAVETETEAPIVVRTEENPLIVQDVESPETESTETEMVQILATLPNWINPIMPKADEPIIVESNAVQQVIKATQKIPIQVPIQQEVKQIVEVQPKEVSKEFVQLIKTIQRDIQKVEFEPETQEAKLHFERLRKPMVQVIQMENTHSKIPVEVRTVEKVVLPLVERAHIDLNEITSIIKQHDQSKDGTYTLKLKPEGIGEIVIKFEQKENTFKLSLHSPNPEVHNLFEKVLPELKNQMQDIQWEVQYGHDDAQKRGQQFHQHKAKFKQEDLEETSMNIRIDHYDRSQT